MPSRGRSLSSTNAKCFFSLIFPSVPPAIPLFSCCCHTHSTCSSLLAVLFSQEVCSSFSFERARELLSFSTSSPVLLVPLSPPPPLAYFVFFCSSARCSCCCCDGCHLVFYISASEYGSMEGANLAVQWPLVNAPAKSQSCRRRTQPRESGVAQPFVVVFGSSSSSRLSRYARVV